MSLINVGICGASGKMGKALVRAVVNNNKLQLSSALEHDSNTNIGKDSGTIANICLLYTSPSPRDGLLSRMPSSA